MSMGKKKNDATKKKGMALSNKELQNVGGGLWYLYVRWPDGKFRLHPRGAETKLDHRRYMNEGLPSVEGIDYKIKYYPLGIGVKKEL